MDPIQKQWFYESWQAEQNEFWRLAKTHACIIGSFWDNERARKILGEEGNSFVTSEDEFKESLGMVKRGAIDIPIIPKRKRRRVKG